MQDLNFDGPQRVLCLGAHADDIEIGCGATVLSLAARARGLSVRWVVFSGSARRADEARASAADFLAGVPDRAIDIKSFRESFFPAQAAEIKTEFERLKAAFDPTLIFTHLKTDDHQDHRVIAELTWNTFRNHLIWEYEIPKYEDDLARPNVYVAVSPARATQKVEAIGQHFRSQRERTWFSPETFLSLMRLRGVHANAASGFAEAFVCRKLRVGV